MKCPKCERILANCNCPGYTGDFIREAQTPPRPLDLLVKCWKIEPHADSEFDQCIIPVRAEEDNRKALAYAQKVLEDLWDSSANDSLVEINVTMKLIGLPESALEEIE